MTTYKIPANWPRDGSESISICPGYGSPTNGFTCGREKDDDAKWCDRCQDSVDLDAREEKKAQAWRDRYA